MSEPLLSRLIVRQVESSAQRAKIFLGVPDCTRSEGWTLAGKVTGPYSKFHSTLTASFPLRSLSSDSSSLALANILEPIYWSPEMPVNYQLDLQLSRRGQVVEESRQHFSPTWLEYRDGHFEWQREKTVLRGCVKEVNALPSIAERTDLWRASNLTFCVPNPELSTGTAGDTSGYCTLQKWSPELGPLPEVLAQWDRSPSVIAALVDAGEQFNHRELAGKATFLAADLRKQSLPMPPFWADVLVVSDKQLAAVDSSQVKRRPILVVAERHCEDDPQAIRDACDALRAELAPIRQCAGYFISSC